MVVDASICGPCMKPPYMVPILLWPLYDIECVHTGWPVKKKIEYHEAKPKRMGKLGIRAEGVHCIPYDSQLLQLM